MGKLLREVTNALSLYVRQLAWLNTPVDPDKKAKAKPYARIARFKHEKLAIDLPENPAPYLTDWLMEVGPIVSGGMGQAPIGWGDLTNWQQLTGVSLNPWEARTLRKLSQDFLSQKSVSNEANCPAPYVENPLANEDAVAEQFKRMLRR